MNRKPSVDLARSLRGTTFFPIKGLPAFCVLTFAALAYLTIGAASFLHVFFGLLTDDNVLLGEFASRLKLSLLLLFPCHFFLLGILRYVLKSDVYEAPYFEKIFSVRLARFHRKYIENNDFWGFLNHLEGVVMLEIFGFLYWLFPIEPGNSGAMFSFADASILGKLFILLFCIPAFIHYTWAFPLMFYYLLNLLDQIVDNSAERLGNYLSGWEYRRRQLENEGAN